MNMAIYNIVLDIHKTGSQVALSMIRGENKRKIVISLMENGRPYKIADKCKAVFTATKPDGNFIYNDCEIDLENNLIIYNVTSQTSAVMGEVKCQLKLIGVDGGLLFSPTFSLVVADTLYSEQPIKESSEEFNALTIFLADLQQKLASGEFKGEKGDAGKDGTITNIDQTYNPESENPQSGKAVAGAIEIIREYLLGSVATLEIVLVTPTPHLLDPSALSNIYKGTYYRVKSITEKDGYKNISIHDGITDTFTILPLQNVPDNLSVNNRIILNWDDVYQITEFYIVKDVADKADKSVIGDIGTALDQIIALQESIMGGE